MPSVLDRLGLGPTREVVEIGDGRWRVTVTPPTYTSFKPSSVDLNAGQYERYLRWRRSGGLIQEHLSDLSADDREILMTGIGSEEWQSKVALPDGEEEAS